MSLSFYQLCGPFLIQVYCSATRSQSELAYVIADQKHEQQKSFLEKSLYKHCLTMNLVNSYLICILLFPT